MKYNKKILSGLLILSGVFLSSLTSTISVEASDKFGAVLVAHSSRNTDWNQEISTFHAKVANQLNCPVEVAFLGFINEMSLEAAIGRLMEDEVTQILLVYLSPSSYIHNEQIKTFSKEVVAKVSKPAASTKQSIEIVAMDDHPLAVKILKDYAKDTSGQSGNPEKESLILVGYGPSGELENISSLIDLENIGEKIQNEVGFREVISLNLRPHSPDVIFVKAINDLQRTAKRLKAQGRVIVVPYVLQNDFDKELESYLRGIVSPVDISKQALVSHSNMEQWVKEVINAGIEQPVVKKINRNWSAMKGKKGQALKVKNFGLTDN